MKKLSVDWTKHLRDPQAREDFEALVRNSTQVLSRLKDILNERQDNINSSDADFTTPSWAYQQASNIGKRNAYKDIDQLLSFLGG